MSANSKLTVATHALAWMALNERQGCELTTSDQIANSVKTNPVVIRRLMSEMSKAGLIESRRGAGAGWRLARSPETISLWDIDKALGPEATFAMHRNEPSDSCPIARGIRPALLPVYARVDDAIRRELASTSLAEVLRDTLSVSGA
ncbi:Rrf2 family transcriptional regulator [Streptomyces nodosus]